MMTHEEIQIILEAQAQGKEYVYLPNPTGLPFCGRCGRIICHPDCPRRRQKVETKDSL